MIRNISQLIPAQLTTLGVLLVLGLTGCQDDPSPTGPSQFEPQMAQVAAKPVVNSLADPGNGTCDDTECTLREAIAFVEEDGEIDFAPGLTGTIVLNGSNLEVPRSMTIRGPGADLLAVSGNGSVRGFAVFPGTGSTKRPAVEIHGLTIRDGNSSPFGGYGGAIFMHKSDLSLFAVTITNNVSYSSGGYSDGGGIYAKGNVSLTDCVVTGNTARAGGGIYLQPDIYGYAFLSLSGTTVADNSATANSGGVALASGAGGTIVTSNFTGNHSSYSGGLSTSMGSVVSITNSTFSGNTADISGGGISSFASQISLTDVTVTDNSAGGQGGGIRGYQSSSLLIRNSLVAGNVALEGADIYKETGTALTATFSLVGDSDANGLTNGVDNNIVGLSPVLGDLADNGGLTKTHALLEGSPAIDAGACTDASGTTIATDQRGISRPQGNGCDIGAYELEGGVSEPPTISALIEASEEAGLSRGTVNKLWDVLKHLEAGRTTPALSNLQAFINDVESQIGKKVTAEDAESLIAAAQEIMEIILADS